MFNLKCLRSTLVVNVVKGIRSQQKRERYGNRRNVLKRVDQITLKKHEQVKKMEKGGLTKKTIQTVEG